MSVFKINQRISIGDQYNILNDQNQRVYLVKSKLVSLAPKLTVYNDQDQVVAEINKKLVSIVPEYEIFINGKKEATIRKKFISLFGPKLEVEGPGWEIEGDFVSWAWTIKKGFTTIAQARKKLISLTDHYVLDVMNDANDLLAICCAIVVDLMEEENEKDEKNK